MNVRELREALKEFPDDMEVEYDDSEAGLCSFETLSIVRDELSPQMKQAFKKAGLALPRDVVVVLR